MLTEKIQRILKRVDRTLSGSVSLFPDQFIYGAREIFCAYCNFDNRIIFRATFEHGWAIESAKPIRKLTGYRYPHFSWSQQRINRSRNQNSSMIPIGAPYIYLVSLLKPAIDKAKTAGLLSQNKIIYFPTHGNEVEFQNSELQIKSFKKRYDPNNTTVCLYWADFINPNLLKQYHRAGFKNIVTTGFSGQMEHTGLGYSARQLAASPIGGRNLFYLNLITLLAQHQKVVLGGFGSICFYAAYLGKEIDCLEEYINGKHFTYNLEQNPYTENYYSKAHRFLSDSMQVPFFEINFSSEKFRELANIELGVKHLKTPEDLKEIMRKHISVGNSSIASEITKEAVANFYVKNLNVN